MDLMLRTSGECRLSDFLLAQAASAHLHFAAALWPDFSFVDMLAALAEYQRAAPGLARTRAACEAGELGGEGGQWGAACACGGDRGCTAQAAAGCSVPCSSGEAEKAGSCGDRGVGHYDLVAAADVSAALERARDPGRELHGSCSSERQQVPGAASGDLGCDYVRCESSEAVKEGGGCQCRVSSAASSVRIRRFLRTRTDAVSQQTEFVDMETAQCK